MEAYIGGIYIYIPKLLKNCARITTISSKELESFVHFFLTESHFLSFLQPITVIAPGQISGLHHWSITSGDHDCSALVSLSACELLAIGHVTDPEKAWPRPFGSIENSQGSRETIKSLPPPKKVRD